MASISNNKAQNYFLFTVLDLPTKMERMKSNNNLIYQDKIISESILNILTENDDDELKNDTMYIDWIAKNHKISLHNLLNNSNIRSDVRGYCAKLLIENSDDIERDILIAQIENQSDSLITFGILFGLEEKEDYERILNYFISYPNKRIKDTALDILKDKNKIYFSLKTNLQ